MSAEDLRKRGMACILLWMGGGPSQFETFSPKPGHENGGETKAISTAVSGIQIADSLPKCAGAMKDLAIVRSMTSKEGSHPRATFLLHHGYLPMGGVKFPTLGSHVAQQIGTPGFDIPSFVRIGGRGGGDAGGGRLLGRRLRSVRAAEPRGQTGEYAAGHARRALRPPARRCSKRWKRISARSKAPIWSAITKS